MANSKLKIVKRLNKLERLFKSLYCTFKCLSESKYASHEEAAANGVRVGQVFQASADNELGVQEGSLIVRQEI